MIAADECYSEIYFDEGARPLGALAAAQQLGRGFNNLIVFNTLFNTLSKRCQRNMGLYELCST